jgi:hypothetical protein
LRRARKTPLFLVPLALGALGGAYLSRQVGPSGSFEAASDQGVAGASAAHAAGSSAAS